MLVLLMINAVWVVDKLNGITKYYDVRASEVDDLKSIAQTF